MQFEKYLTRIAYLKELIQKESTGTPDQLAARLGVSRRMLFNYLEVVKSDSKEKISFCRKIQSYKFLE